MRLIWYLNGTSYFLWFLSSKQCRPLFKLYQRGELFCGVMKLWITTDSGSSSSNKHSSNHRHTNSASPRGNALPVGEHIHNSRAGDIPTVK